MSSPQAYPSVKEIIEVENIDVEEAFELCEEWLYSIKAKIIEKKRPYYLKANHVRHIGDKDDWYRSRDGVVLPSWRIKDMEKIIILKLSLNEKRVSIDVTLLPHVYIQWLDSFKNRAKKWPSLITELKEFIEKGKT